MRRLIVFALLVCGCTTPEVAHQYSPSTGFAKPNPSMPELSYRPGEPTRVGECPFTVVFPGPPKSNDQKSQFTPASIDRALTLTYENSSMAFSANCGCSDTTSFGDITRIEALSWLENSAKQIEVSLLYYDYEDSKMGKMVHFEGDMPSTQGPLKLDGRRYYFGQCSVGVIVGGKLREYNYDQAMTFLRSTTRDGMAPEPTPPTGATRPILNDPTVLCHLKDSADIEISLSVCNSRGGWVTPAGAVAPSAPPSVADRLQALKDLLDRKVITPEEYAAKRKEILKSL